MYEGEVREQGWLDENHTWNLLSMYEEGGLVQEHDEALYDGWDEKDIPRENTPDLYIYNDQEKQPWICVKFDEIEFLET